MRRLPRAFALLSSLGAAAFALTADAQAQPQKSDAGQERPEKSADGLLKPDQLEALVAPIALYPDPLLAQVLMACTYPLEVVQAARWSKANPKVTGKELEDAMLKQPWDPSVKSMCSIPDTLAMMNEHLEWTQDLGDAFLAQQGDVMDAVQALRAKAVAAGNLKSSKELTVTTEKPQAPPADAGVVVQPAAQQQQVIVIQPANPQVVYVPQYNPVVVYGAWPYPAYPPYPVYPPGYVAATAAISFGVGLAIGAAMWGNCSWGYHGHSNVNINVNNYNRVNHTNISNNGNRNANWNHASQHRQGVGYKDSASQKRYGGGNSPSAGTRESYRGRGDTGSGGGPCSGQRPAGGARSGWPECSTTARWWSAEQVARVPRNGPLVERRSRRPECSATARWWAELVARVQHNGPAGGAGGPSAAQRPATGGSSSNRGGGSAFQGMNNGSQARAASSAEATRVWAAADAGAVGDGAARRGDECLPFDRQHAARRWRRLWSLAWHTLGRRNTSPRPTRRCRRWWRLPRAARTPRCWR